MSDPLAQQLGNYRLIGLLGHGGFADVFLGEHVYLKTQAAIKVLRTQITSDNLESFITEAQTIGRLRHPNIIRVLDFGVQNNTPFLVMDYASRGTLRQRHSRGSRLPLATILPYVKQIAEALHYAHNEKLIHRDIKPENMLLGPNNEILLSDFGIATLAQSSRYQLTQDVVGTVSYMAPEQIQGKPRPVSDEYALGIVIYEWLTGSCPFQGSFTEIATQHVFAPPPPLQEKLPMIPPDVERVLMMSLAKDPQQRFASLQAFANALEQACGKAPEAALLTNAPTFISPFSPASEPTPVLSQSELLTFVKSPVADPTRTSAPMPAVFATIKSLTQLPGENTPPPPEKPRRISRRMLLGGLGSLAVVGGGLIAWFGVVEGPQLFSHASGLNSTVTPSSPSPTATAKPTAAPSPTATAAPSPTPTPRPTANPTQPPQPTAVPVSPALLTYVGPSKMYTVAWSPNGAWIASAGSGSTVQIWSSSSKQQLFSYDGGSAKVYSVAWSPDGRYVASGHSNGTIQIWDISAQSKIFYQHGHTSNVNSVAWSPDGSSIVSGSGDRTANVKVWNVSTGNLLLTYNGHLHFVNAVAWSHDGTRIVSGGGDATAQVWDATAGSMLYTYGRHTSDILALSWSPNDTRIVSASKDTTAQVWDASTGSRFVYYDRHSNYVNADAWSPDGTRIASGSVDTTVKVWGAASGSTFLTYRGHSDQVQSVSWSPDSTKIASASDDGTVLIWQAS